MKKTTVLLTIISLIIIAGAGCNEDKTELAWINDAGAPINDIIWADGDEEWHKANGYADQEQTESKEVNVLNGTVIAGIEIAPGSFQEGTVIIQETNSSSLSLNEGSSEVYTIDTVITGP